MMKRTVCSGIILLSSFYAWVMTATGIQLTQYRPAFSGFVGAAQPYVLAGLVQIAIAYYYLKLASPRMMGKREVMSMLAAAPLVLIFVGWTILMSSYSIMFERRSETARVESGNQLQSISDELRDLDRQVAVNYASTLINLDKRLESEISRPEPGVPKGCGRRCREIRSVQSELQNFQHLREPGLGPSAIGVDLARALGVLEGEQQTIAARLADFDAALGKFSRLNAVLAERALTADDVSSRLSGQFRGHLDRLRARIAELRGDERNLTDAKYRGLTELVNDLTSAINSGQTARLLDLFTIVLIAIAPDFLSLIMALLSRTAVAEVEPHHVAQVEGMGVLVKKLRRQLWRRSTAEEMMEVKAVVKEHLTSRARPDQFVGMVAVRPASKTPIVPVAAAGNDTPTRERAAKEPVIRELAPREPVVKEPESIYDTLNKMDLQTTSRRPTSSRG